MAQLPSRVSNQVVGAVTQTIEIDVEASAAVDDLVRINTSIADRADVAVDNNDPRVVVGIIRSKISDTRAVVALSGVIDDPDSTSSGIIYLSATGRLTSNPPTSNYVQKLGFSFGNGKVDLKPDKTHVKLT